MDFTSGNLVANLPSQLLVLGRIQLDWVRLSRGADSLYLAGHQQPVWRAGHLWFPEGYILLLSGQLESQAGAACVSALELVHARPDHQRLGLCELPVC